MKVHELIAKLQKLPPNHRVVIDTPEGLNDIDEEVQDCRLTSITSEATEDVVVLVVGEELGDELHF